ncbi:hypothetical protein EDD18DRAFT_1117382 [Armillaria luteobubalina]|uniref:Uncharacterized protein n=1 Tax=Armillaria luteobubalina TaxID=153913 RepID=A0AA39UCC0_9AGAR|nr:hypothetical protein EDD18DRAFT_1117377 [Armillaria luteobubalina]KAK0473510.1 hypothetical protein EDD18DRAFT_1117382 [Armillaria luteobubalina]
MLCSVEDALCLAAVMGASSSSSLTLILTFQFWPPNVSLPPPFPPASFRCFRRVQQASTALEANLKLNFVPRRCIDFPQARSTSIALCRGLPSLSMGSGVRGGRTWPLSITVRSCTLDVTSGFCAKTTYRLPASKVNEDCIAYRVVPLEYGLRGAGREDVALVLVATYGGHLIIPRSSPDGVTGLFLRRDHVHWQRWCGVGAGRADHQASSRLFRFIKCSPYPLVTSKSVALVHNISLDITLCPAWHPNFARRRRIAFRSLADEIVAASYFRVTLTTASYGRAPRIEFGGGRMTDDVDREDDDPPIAQTHVRACRNLRATPSRQGVNHYTP